jgi:hypothetical protein
VVRRRTACCRIGGEILRCLRCTTNVFLMCSLLPYTRRDSALLEVAVMMQLKSPLCSVLYIVQ